MIEWNSNYELGIPKIDQQHRIILNMINKFIEIQKIPDNRNQTEEILSELINYCDYHFKTEELLIDIFNYHLLEGHKKEHNRFTVHIEKVILNYNDGSMKSVDHLVDYFIIWILDHILVHDRNYAQFMKRNLSVQVL